MTLIKSSLKKRRRNKKTYIRLEIVLTVLFFVFFLSKGSEGQVPGKTSFTATAEKFSVPIEIIVVGDHQNNIAGIFKNWEIEFKKSFPDTELFNGIKILNSDFGWNKHLGPGKIFVKNDPDYEIIKRDRFFYSATEDIIAKYRDKWPGSEASIRQIFAGGRKNVFGCNYIALDLNDEINSIFMHINSSFLSKDEKMYNFCLVAFVYFRFAVPPEVEVQLADRHEDLDRRSRAFLDLIDPQYRQIVRRAVQR